MFLIHRICILVLMLGEGCFTMFTFGRYGRRHTDFLMAPAPYTLVRLQTHFWSSSFLVEWRFYKGGVTNHSSKPCESPHCTFPLAQQGGYSNSLRDFWTIIFLERKTSIIVVIWLYQLFRGAILHTYILTISKSYRYILTVSRSNFLTAPLGKFDSVSNRGQVSSLVWGELDGLSWSFYIPIEVQNTKFKST